MNNNKDKNIQAWIIVFAVVILIGLCSTVSLFFYSTVDMGTLVSDPIELENAKVVLLEDINHSMVKFDFYNIVEEKTESYTVSFVDKKGMVLDSFKIEVEYKYENMKSYEYKVDADLNDVVYYKIEKNPD